MDLKKVDLNLLVALEALLQEQSVTKAAARIGRSQPAMSRALARLRKTFDDPLFVAVGRGLGPTARALELRRRLAPILDDVRDLLDPPRFDPSTATTEFRINAPDATVMLLLGEFLARVAEKAPHMDVTISSAAAGQLDALDAGEIDLAVDTFVDAPDEFHRQSLFESHLVAVVRQEHPARRQTFDLSAFLIWPHIWIDTATSRVLDAQLERQGIQRRCSVRINSFFTGAMIAAKTDCIMVLPDKVASRACELAPLAMLPMPVKLPRLTLDQLWHPRRQHEASHIWLRNTIVEVARMIE
jgi:DNA-binding transcriptional LysR family regulator